MKRHTGLVKDESSVKRLRTVNVNEESDKERDKRVRNAENCRRYRQRQKEKIQEIRNKPLGDGQPSKSVAKAGMDSEQRARKQEYQRRYRQRQKEKEKPQETNNDNAQPSTSTAVTDVWYTGCGDDVIYYPT